MIIPFRIKNVKPRTLSFLRTQNQRKRNSDGIYTKVTRDQGHRSFADVEIGIHSDGNVYHFANLVNKALRENNRTEMVF
jgi:hypothetical protein